MKTWIFEPVPEIGVVEFEIEYTNDEISGVLWDFFTYNKEENDEIVKFVSSGRLQEILKEQLADADEMIKNGIR